MDYFVFVTTKNGELVINVNKIENILKITSDNFKIYISGDTHYTVSKGNECPYFDIDSSFENLKAQLKHYNRLKEEWDII